MFLLVVVCGYIVRRFMLVMVVFVMMIEEIFFSDFPCFCVSAKFREIGFKFGVN